MAVVCSQSRYSSLTELSLRTDFKNRLFFFFLVILDFLFIDFFLIFFFNFFYVLGKTGIEQAGSFKTKS